MCRNKLTRVIFKLDKEVKMTSKRRCIFSLIFIINCIFKMFFC